MKRYEVNEHPHEEHGQAKSYHADKRKDRELDNPTVLQLTRLKNPPVAGDIHKYEAQDKTYSRCRQVVKPQNIAANIQCREIHKKPRAPCDQIFAEGEEKTSGGIL